MRGARLIVKRSRREFRDLSKSDLIRIAEVQSAKAIHARNTVVLRRQLWALVFLLGVVVGMGLEVARPWIERTTATTVHLLAR